MEDPKEMSAEQNSTKGERAENGKSTPAETARIAELEGQLGQARQEATENWNKYLRERAEWDNFRKRQERLLAERVQNQKKSFFNKLLEVMDNVERALVYQETLDKP